MRILVVEDDAVLRSVMTKSLHEAGHRVDAVQRLAEAEQLWQYQPFDAVLLDLNLPDGNALDGLRRARARGDRTPVLVLTARNRTDERIAGLDAGADDYLGKPFDTDELVARMRALHRRGTGQGSIRIEHGALVLDPVARLATYEGRLVELPRREFALLQLLLENAGRVVTREAAQQRLYGWNEDLDSNALDVHVHHLRRKFHPGLIRTVRGVGFLVEAAP